MKKIIILILTCAMCIMASAQDKNEWKTPKDMYIFGFATSFTDTTAYVTAVMHVENTSIKKKNGFLYARNEYSYQLRDYVEQMGFKNPVVVVCFNQDKKKLEKKFMKMMAKNIKSGTLLKHLSAEQFKFVGVEYVAPEYSYDEEAKPAVADKKVKKKSKKKK